MRPTCPFPLAGSAALSRMRRHGWSHLCCKLLALFLECCVWFGALWWAWVDKILLKWWQLGQVDMDITITEECCSYRSIALFGIFSGSWVMMYFSIHYHSHCCFLMACCLSLKQNNVTSAVCGAVLCMGVVVMFGIACLVCLSQT